MTGIGRLGRDATIVAWRNLLNLRRTPGSVIAALVQPVMFVLLLAYVFGGSLGGAGYRTFLMGGIFAQAVTFNAAFTALGLANDMDKGIVDRFRALPMPRLAVLLGRTLSDLVMSAVTLAVTSLCGLLVGWRITGSVADAVLAYLLVLLFAFAMSWVGAAIGLLARSVEVAQSAGLIWLFPVTFVSSAFVSTHTMPGPCAASPSGIRSQPRRRLCAGCSATRRRWGCRIAGRGPSCTRCRTRWSAPGPSSPCSWRSPSPASGGSRSADYQGPAAALSVRSAPTASTSAADAAGPIPASRANGARRRAYFSARASNPSRSRTSNRPARVSVTAMPRPYPTTSSTPKAVRPRATAPSRTTRAEGLGTRPPAIPIPISPVREVRAARGAWLWGRSLAGARSVPPPRPAVSTVSGTCS